MPKKQRSSSRAHRTQHSRACGKPETKNLLQKLQAAWPDLNVIDRGDKLKSLLDLGCTIRGLAGALDLDEKTARRSVSIAELPQEVRDAIATGYDPEIFLRSDAEQKIEAAAWERAGLERLDGGSSDDLANKLAWLAVSEDRGLARKYLDQILEEAEFVTYLRTARLRRIDMPRPPCPVSHAYSFVKLVGICRDKNPGDVLFDSIVMSLITEVILRWEQVPFVREAAFRKARLLLKDCPDADLDPQLAVDLGFAAYMANCCAPAKLQYPSCAARRSFFILPSVVCQSLSKG